MKFPVIITLACLPWSLVHGQDAPPTPKDEKKSERVIHVLIAGQRAMPVFEKKGDEYIEVEPATKSIVPNAIELPDAPQLTEKSPAVSNC